MERTEGQEISSACLTAIRQPASPTAVHELEQLGKTNKNLSSTVAPAKLLIKESSLHPCFKQLASTLHISQNIGVKKAGKQTNPITLPFIKQTNRLPSISATTGMKFGLRTAAARPVAPSREMRGLKFQEELPGGCSLPLVPHRSSDSLLTPW